MKPGVLSISIGVLLSIDMRVFAQDTHTAIDPSIDFSGAVDEGLLNTLSPTGSFWDHWEDGWIPQDCKSIAEENGVSAGDMEVFNVYYDDCDQAWVMCRHKDARKSQTDMVDVSVSVPCWPWCDLTIILAIRSNAAPDAGVHHPRCFDP